MERQLKVNVVTLTAESRGRVCRSSKYHLCNFSINLKLFQNKKLPLLSHLKKAPPEDRGIHKVGVTGTTEQPHYSPILIQQLEERCNLQPYLTQLSNWA